MDENLTEFSFHVNEKFCHCTCLPLIIRLKGPAEGAHLAIDIIIAAITVFTLVAGGALNSLILIAYRKNRELQTSWNVSLMILTVTDLFVCAVVQPVFVAKSIAEIYTAFHCPLWVTFTMIGMCGLGVSLMTITIISIERFVSLAYPFRYREIVTKSRLKAVFALLSALICLTVVVQASIAGSNVKIAFVGVGILTALSLITGTWLWIHRLTERHKRQINALNTPSNITKIVRNTKTCYLVVGSSLVCFFPAFVSQVFYVVVLQPNSDLLYFAYTHVSPFCHVLMNFTSLLNPLILLYRKRDFRQAVRHLLL